MKKQLITGVLIGFLFTVFCQKMIVGQESKVGQNVQKQEDVVFDELQKISEELENFCWYFFKQFRERKPEDFTQQYFSEKIDEVSKTIDRATADILTLKGHTLSEKMKPRLKKLTESVAGKALRLRRMFTLLFDKAKFPSEPRQSLEDILHAAEETLLGAIAEVF